MKRLRLPTQTGLRLSIFLGCLLVLPALSANPAFPGAYGYGADAQGGRGGEVIFVTSLDDSGPGTLREAIMQDRPRYIVFRIGGTITLQSELKIKYPFVTIAGQTSPGDGICLRIADGGNFPAIRITRAHDVVLRHLRIRPGPGGYPAENNDAITIENASHVMIDHCSLSWAVDENLNTWGITTDVTIQNSIISEALYQSTHRKGPHSMGALFGFKSDRITVYRNLFAHNNQRNALFVAGHTHALNHDMKFQFVNNVIYNWGAIPTELKSENSSRLRGNIHRNYYIPGVDSDLSRHQVRLSRVDDSALFHAIGNIGPVRPHNRLPHWDIMGDNQGNDLSTSYKSNPPIQMPHLAFIPPHQVVTKVLNDVGATRPSLDKTDSRIIREVRQGEGRIIDHPWQVEQNPYAYASGSAPLDDDLDGMPDWWEDNVGLPKKRADTNEDPDGDGYPNIEEYFNRTDPFAADGA